MMRRLFIFSVALSMIASSAYAEDKNEEKNAESNKNPESATGSQKTTSERSFKLNKKRVYNKYILREAPAHYFADQPEEQAVSQDSVVPFKPSVQVGAIVHMYGYSQQGGFGPGPGGSTDWGRGFEIYRSRVLVGGQLSKKGAFFFETDLPISLGRQIGTATNPQKTVEISQLVLDCQYEHTFSQAFQVIAGKQLVSNNRNGLQGAASLMANDFTFYQYPHNMFGNSGLLNNYGRDLGVNFRGLVAKSKLEYRLGFFTGANLTGTAPLRTVGRLVYNFLDADKSYYYSGTNLGSGKTVSLGAGFDNQASYVNVGTDLFVDVPVSKMGSVTFNGAIQFMNGGTGTGTYSGYFASQIPKKTVQFAELGYYFKSVKLQPYLRFENQAVSAEAEQIGTAASIDDFNKLNSASVFGGGLNYFFNGYGTNLRLSYTTFTKSVLEGADINKKTFGQVWLQLQFFVF